MFDNIGRKIKMLAQILCWIGIVSSVIAGFVLIIKGMMSSRDSIFAGIGFGVMIVGSLFSWIGSFFLYGFGQLIDDTQAMRSKIAPEEKSSFDNVPDAKKTAIQHNNTRIEEDDYKKDSLTRLIIFIVVGAVIIAVASLLLFLNL